MKIILCKFCPDPADFNFGGREPLCVRCALAVWVQRELLDGATIDVAVFGREAPACDSVDDGITSLRRSA